MNAANGQHADTRIRLFLGVPVTGLAVPILATVLTDLRGASGSTEAVRITPAENLHVTVWFFGQVRTEALQAVRAAVTTAAGMQNVFRFRDPHLIAVPRREQGMIWCRFAEQPEFTALVERLHSTVVCLHQKYGKAVPQADVKTPVVPHITLARCRGNANHVFGSGRLPDVPDFTLEASRVRLYRSFLSPDGSRYDTVGEYTMQTEGAVAHD